MLTFCGCHMLMVPRDPEYFRCGQWIECNTEIVSYGSECFCNLNSPFPPLFKALFARMNPDSVNISRMPLRE